MVCIKCRKSLPDGAEFCCYCGKALVRKPKRRRSRRANNTGTVYKLSGNRRRPWAAAKDSTIIGYYETKAEAEAALSALGGTRIPPSFNITVEGVYKAWVQERTGQPTFSGSWGHVPPNIRDKRIRMICAQDFQAVIDSMVEKGLKRATCDKVKQLLNFLSKWAMREDVIAKNYAEYIRLPPDDSEEGIPFSDEDLLKLFQHDGHPDVMAVLCLIFTGFRISEFLQVTRQRVNMEDLYIIGGIKTEAGKNRVVPICDTIAPYIKYFYDHPREGFDRPQDPLLQNMVGKRYDRNVWSRDHFKLALDLCGITEHYTPHSTRHTFATLGARLDMPREELKHILGHKKYETSANVYIHPSLPALKAAAKLLDNLEITNKLLTAPPTEEQEKTP